MELLAGPEDGAEIGGSALLKVLIPWLWADSKRYDCLRHGERSSLRACSRETLRLSDSCVRTLRWDRRFPPAQQRPWAAAVAALHSVLARGCRPRKLGLRSWASDVRCQPAAMTAFGLRVLAEFRAVPLLHALTELSLSGLPLTAAVVRALAAAAPCLCKLFLSGYDMSYCTGLRSSLPFRPSLSGVQGLLRLTAPHLQQLSLGLTDAPTCLAPLLLQCSRLEALELRFWPKVPAPKSFGAPLSALAQLPALRSLDINDLSWAHDADCCVMLPTGLTQLELHGTPDLDAVAPALARMRSLAELQLDSCKLRPRHLQQMTGLTALTRLGVEGIWATDDPTTDGAAAPPQPRVPLPPQLRLLVFFEPATPSELAALQLPSALLQVWVSELAVYASDKDAEGCLCSPAAEVLLAACRQLAGRLWLDPDGDGFQLELCGAAAPPSWPDGYGTLFAAMQPLALRGLTVQNATLTLYDMDALVRHLPLLEDLYLSCAVELPSLPLLCRLKRLAFLTLSPGKGGVVEGWDSELALRTALLVVCVEAPSLKDVCLSVDHEHAALFEAAALAVEWLQEELPTLRANPPDLQVA